MFDATNFVFSENDIKTFPKEEVVKVIEHIKNIYLEEPTAKNFYGGIYFEILKQCNPITLLIGHSGEDGSNEKSTLYFFTKEKTELNFIGNNIIANKQNGETKLLLENQNGFPASMLLEEKIFLVENNDINIFLKEFENLNFKETFEITTYFSSLKNAKNGVYSLLGTTLWQTWNFYIENGKFYYLSPEADKSSNKIYWKKKDCVPMSFLFETIFIDLYYKKTFSNEDITETIVLQKMIFDTLNKNCSKASVEKDFYSEPEARPRYYN